MPTVRDRSGTTQGLDLGQHFPIPGFNDSQDAPGPGVKGSPTCLNLGVLGSQTKGHLSQGSWMSPRGLEKSWGRDKMLQHFSILDVLSHSPLSFG